MTNIRTSEQADDPRDGLLKKSKEHINPSINTLFFYFFLVKKKMKKKMKKKKKKKMKKKKSLKLM